MLQPPALRPSVILLDEPELGLHPYAIAILASLVKQASVDTQIVISTQSSLLLDEFRPEDVLVADRVDGATELRGLDAGRLADSPNFAPSKRVQALVAGYQKPWMGTLAALAVGLDAMRDACPHFGRWLNRLERSPRVAARAAT